MFRFMRGAESLGGPAVGLKRRSSDYGELSERKRPSFDFSSPLPDTEKHSDVQGSLDAQVWAQEMVEVLSEAHAAAAGPRAHHTHYNTHQQLIRVLKAFVVSPEGLVFKGPSQDWLQACQPFFLPDAALAAEGVSEPASGRLNPSAWEDTSIWQLADALHASAAACHLLLLGQAAEAVSLLTAASQFVMEEDTAAWLDAELMPFHSPALSLQELRLGVLELLRRALVEKARQECASAQQAATMEALRRACTCLVEAAPTHPAGHYAVGEFAVQSLADAELAHMHFTRGYQLADAMRHAFFGATCRYQLAWAVIHGGSGAIYTREAVEALLQQGEALEEHLAYLSEPKRAAVAQMKARVRAALDSAHAEPGAPIQAEALKPEHSELVGDEEHNPGTTGTNDSEQVEAAKAPSTSQ